MMDAYFSLIFALVATIMFTLGGNLYWAVGSALCAGILIDCHFGTNPRRANGES